MFLNLQSYFLTFFSLKLSQYSQVLTGLAKWILNLFEKMRRDFQILSTRPFDYQIVNKGVWSGICRFHTSSFPHVSGAFALSFLLSFYTYCSSCVYESLHVFIFLLCYSKLSSGCLLSGSDFNWTVQYVSC